MSREYVRVIHRVRLSTGVAEIEAFGDTMYEALMAFRRGWDIHAASIGACQFESLEFAERLFPILKTDVIVIGECYRNHRIVK